MSDNRKQVFELLGDALKETKAFCMEKKQTDDKKLLEKLLEKIKDLAIKAIIGNLYVELFLAKHSYEGTDNEDTAQEESAPQKYIEKLNEITENFTSLTTEINEVDEIKKMSLLKEKIMNKTLELAKDNYYKYMDIDDFINDLVHISRVNKTILQEEYEKEKVTYKNKPNTELRECNQEMIPMYGLKRHAINAINKRKDELQDNNLINLNKKLGLDEGTTIKATIEHIEEDKEDNDTPNLNLSDFFVEGGHNIKKYRRKTKKVKKKNKQMSKKRRH
tara:strand:- start:136 stop:963 length:828 start_codon:yes stop_codon:yes gene_type:complete